MCSLKASRHLLINYIDSSLIAIGSITLIGSYYLAKQFFAITPEQTVLNNAEIYWQYIKNKRPKRIILIRNGETSANLDSSVYAHVPNHLYPLLFIAINFTRIELTEKGQQQALNAEVKLKEIIGDETVRFYVSPFNRSKQTYQNIIKSLNPGQYNYQEDPRIREQEFGNLEKFLLDENKSAEVWKERELTGGFFYRFKNGVIQEIQLYTSQESGADAYDRYTLFLDTLLRRIDNTQKRAYDNYAIVTVNQLLIIQDIFFQHGLLMQLFLMRYLKLSIEKFEQLENPKNGDIWIMNKNEEGYYYLVPSNDS